MPFWSGAANSDRGILRIKYWSYLGPGSENRSLRAGDESPVAATLLRFRPVIVDCIGNERIRPRGSDNMSIALARVGCISCQDAIKLKPALGTDGHTSERVCFCAAITLKQLN